MTDADEIVLVRQYRHAIGRWAWELPAGSLKPARTSSARRGASARKKSAWCRHTSSALGSFFPTPGYCDEEMHFFKATGLREPGAGDEEAQQDEDEDIEARPFARDQLQTMIASGEIIDLKTVAGLSLIE